VSCHRRHVAQTILPWRCFINISACNFLFIQYFSSASNILIVLRSWRSRFRFPTIDESFNWPNPSSRTMSLRSAQSITEMSTRYLPGSKWRPVSKTENITAIYEPNVWKMLELRRFTTLCASTVHYNGSFTIFKQRYGNSNVCPPPPRFLLLSSSYYEYYPRKVIIKSVYYVIVNTKCEHNCHVRWIAEG
jgi:hypothetical protein